jgi:hypothetical protein
MEAQKEGHDATNKTFVKEGHDATNKTFVKARE